MEIRNRFSERKPVVKYFEETGKTKPEFKESCDVNYILEKYKNTGELPLMQRKPIYGDFSNPVDYQTSLHVVMKAEQQFNELPAEVRKRFDNDPALFLDFAIDPANKKEMIEMELLEPERPPVVENEIISESSVEESTEP